MIFNLCAGVVNGIAFAGGVYFLFSGTMPLFFGALLIAVSAFCFGLIFGGSLHD
jgi:hypothetical protein